MIISAITTIKEGEMNKLFYGILGAILLLAMIAGPAVARTGVLSGGALTVGGRFGEAGYSQGYLDILAPVFRPGNGLVFINPRGTIGDGNRQEVNLGLGYRHLLPDSKMILGGNVYYDSSWSLNDNQFDQLGLGVEMLTQWVDARFNYYLPEDSTKSTGS
ncbi:MAG: inverse autotransporter beta domain-containing protein, partial [Desulfosudaceae bacterium]